MVARVRSCAISGVDAVPVDIEVYTSQGSKDKFTIIGLGDTAVRESLDRVLSAMRSIGFSTPRRVLVNLAPAELKKEGSAFDLPIAVGILRSCGYISFPRHSQLTFHGELALDGRLKPIRGITALAIAAIHTGATEVVVPAGNRREAALVPGCRVVGVESLAEVVAYLRGELVVTEYPDTEHVEDNPPWPMLSDVRGQKLGKKALLIAAAGGHNLLMIGPPGCGKSMLAQRLPGILPPLTAEERLEAVKIHSIAGMPIRTLLAGQRPFRSPHHVASEAALVGGGAVPHPGEISLAHNGVLFLDEFPEFRRPALEALRGPLETGMVTVSRSKGRSSFPSRFQLVAAMNSCPCGRRGTAGSECRCSRASMQKYLQKLSRPILDRIDLHVEMDAVALKEMTSDTADEELQIDDQFRMQVARARELQFTRDGKLNSALSPDEIRVDGRLGSDAITMLERSASGVGLSARGVVRVLRVARTIADLTGSERIASQHVSEAVSFRTLERFEKL